MYSHTTIKIGGRRARPLPRYRARQMRSHLADVARGVALIVATLASLAAAPFVLSMISRGHL